MVRIKKTPLKARRGLKHSNGASIHSKASSEGHSPSTRSRRQSSNSAQNQTLSDSIVIDSSPKKKGKQAESPENKSGFHKPDIEAKGCSDNAPLVSDSSNHQSPGKNVDTPRGTGKGGPKKKNVDTPRGTGKGGPNEKKSESLNELESSSQDCMMTHVHTRFNGSRNRHDSAADEVASIELNITDESGANKPKPKPINNSETPRTRSKIKQDNNIDRSDSRLDTRQGKGIEVNTPATKPSMTDKYTEDSQFLTDLEQLRDSIEVQTLDHTSIGIEKHLVDDNETETKNLLENITLIDPPCKIKRGSPRKGLESVNLSEVLNKSVPSKDREEVDLTLDSPCTRTRSTNLTKPPCVSPIQKEPKPVSAVCTPSNNHKGPGRRNKPDSSCENGQVDQCVVSIGTPTARSQANLMSSGDGPQTPGEAELEHSYFGESSVSRTLRTRNELNRLKIDMTISSPSPSSRTITGAASCGAELISPTRSMYQRSDKSGDELMSPTRSRTRRSDKSSDELMSPTRSRTRRSDKSSDELMSPTRSSTRRSDVFGEELISPTRSRSRRSDTSNVGSPSHSTRKLSEKDVKQKIKSKPRSQSPGKSPGLRIKRVWSPRSGVYQGLMPGLLRERQLHLWRHHTNIEAESDTHSDDSDDDFNDLSGDLSESETSGTESKTSGTESETNADEGSDLEDRDSDEDPLHGTNKISRPDRILPTRTCKSPWSSPNGSTISTRSSTRRRGTSLPLSPDFMNYQTKMASHMPDSTSCEVKSPDPHHRNSSQLDFSHKSNTLEQPDFAGKNFGILQSPSLPVSGFPDMKSPKAGCLANVMGSPALPMGQPTKTSGSEESMHQSNFDRENPDYESRHRSPACIPSAVEQVQNPLVPVEVPSDNSKNLTDAYKGPLLTSNSQNSDMKSHGTVTSPGIKRVVPSPLMGRRIMSPYRSGNLSSAFAPPRVPRSETGILGSSQCKTAGHEDNDPGPSTSTGGTTSTTPGKKHKSVTLNDRLGGMQPGLYIDKETLQICSRQVPIRDKKAKRAPISAANLEIMRSRQRMLIERQEELATKRNLLRRQHQFDSGEYNRIALDNRERKNPNAQVQCGRKIRFHEVELRLLNVYSGLMESLEEGRVNHDKCAEYLQKFCQLPLSHYLVRKHHYVVLDILQICFYRDSRKLRKMAKLAMSRVRSMFTIREDRCFMDTFLEEIDTMLKANYEAKKKKGILKERRTQTEADPTVSNMVTIDTLHDDSLDSMMGEAPSGEQRPGEGAADQENDQESRRRPAVNADQDKGEESGISDDDRSADSDDSSSSCDMSEYVGRAASSRRVVRDNTSSDDSDHEVSSLSLSYLESKLSDLSDSFLDVDSDSVSKQLLSFLNEEEAGLSNPKAFNEEHGLSDPAAFRGDHGVSEAGPSNREESKEDLGFSNAAAFRMEHDLSDPSGIRGDALEHEVLGSSNLQINVKTQSDPPENEVRSVKSGQASDINVSRPPSRLSNTNGREYRASPRNQTPINQLHRTINHPSSSAHNGENDDARQTDIDDLFDGLIAGDVALGDINITDYIEDTDHENVLNEFRTNQGTAMNTRTDGVSVSDTGFSLKSSKTVDPKAVASSSESEASSNPQPDLLRRENKAITESNDPTSGMQTRKKRRQFICPLKTASIRGAGPSRDSSENTDCGTSRDSPENTRDARTSRDSPENTRNEVISKDSPENTSNAGTSRASPENTRDAETSRASPENTRDAGTSRDSPENTRDAGRSRDSPENTADAGRSRDSPESTRDAGTSRNSPEITTNVLISKVNVQPDLSQVMTEISARNEMNCNFERAANTVSTWTPRTTRLKVREYVQNVISRAERRAADEESSDESNTHESPNLSSGELSSGRGDFIKAAKPPLEDGSKSSSEESFTPRTSARLKQRKAVNDYDQRPSSLQEHSALELPGELELTFEIPRGEIPQKQEPVVTELESCGTEMESLIKMKTNSDRDSISDTSILYSSETDDQSANRKSKRRHSTICVNSKSRQVAQEETDNPLATNGVDSNKKQVVKKETGDTLATNRVDANCEQEESVVQKEVPTLRNISETSERSLEMVPRSKTPSSDEKDNDVFITNPDFGAEVWNQLNVGDEYTVKNLNEVTRTSKRRKTKVSNPVSNVNSKPEYRVKSSHIIDGEKETQKHASKLEDPESYFPQQGKSLPDLRTSIETVMECVLTPERQTRRSSRRQHTTTEVINLDDQAVKQELIDDLHTYDSDSCVVPKENVSSIESNKNIQDVENPTLVCEFVAEDTLEINKSGPPLQPKKSSRNRRKRRGKKMTLEKSQVINMADEVIKQELIYDHDPYHLESEVLPKENNTKDDHENQKIHMGDGTSPGRNTRSSETHHSIMQRISAQTSPAVHEDELSDVEANLETNDDKLSNYHDTTNSEINHIQEENAPGIDLNENLQDAESLTSVSESVFEDTLEGNQSEPPKKSSRNRRRKRGKKMAEKSQVINLDDVAIKQEVFDDHSLGDLELKVVPKQNNVKDDHKNEVILREDGLIGAKNTRSSKRHPTQSITSPAVCPDESSSFTEEVDPEKNNISHDVHINNNKEKNASSIDSNEKPQDAENPTSVSEAVAGETLETNQFEPLVQPKKTARKRGKRKRGKKMALEESQVINVDDEAIKQEVIDGQNLGDSQIGVVPEANSSKDDHENQKIQTEDFPSPGRNTRSSERHHSIMQRISAQTSPVVHQVELSAADANLETNNDELSICHGTINSEIDYIQEENAPGIDSNENPHDLENSTSVCESAVEKNQPEPLPPPKKTARSKKRKQNKKMTREKSQVINVDDEAIKEELIDDHNPYNLELVPEEDNVKHDHENHKIFTEDVLIAGRNTRSSKRDHNTMQQISPIILPLVCPEESTAFTGEADLEKINICHDVSNSKINYIEEENASGIDSNENPQDVQNLTLVSESVTEDALEKNQYEPLVPPEKSARNRRNGKRGKKMMLEKTQVINLDDVAIKQELIDNHNPGDSQTEVVPGENNSKDVHENEKVHLKDVTSQGRNTRSSKRPKSLMQCIDAQTLPAVHQDELSPAEASLETNNDEVSICHDSCNSEINDIQEQNVPFIDSNENPQDLENPTSVSESVAEDAVERNKSEPPAPPKKSARNRKQKQNKKMALEESQVINVDDEAIKEELIDDHNPYDLELVPEEDGVKHDHGNHKIFTEDVLIAGRHTRSSKRHQDTMQEISPITLPALSAEESTALTGEADLVKNNIGHDVSNSKINYIEEENASGIDSNENPQDAENLTLVCESITEDALEKNQSEPAIPPKKSTCNKKKRKQGKKMTLEKLQVINVDDVAIKQELIDDHNPGDSQTEVVPGENNSKDDHEDQKVHPEDVASPGRNTRSSRRHKSLMQSMSAQTSPAVHQDELSPAEANLETNNDEVSICHDSCNSEINNIQEQNAPGIDSNENPQDLENSTLGSESVAGDAVEKNQPEPLPPPKKSVRNRKQKRNKKMVLEKSHIINLVDESIKQELIEDKNPGDSQTEVVPGENNAKDVHENQKVHLEDVTSPDRNTQSMRHENLMQSMSAQNSPVVHQVELMVAEANLEKNNNINHANSNSEIDNIQEENASFIDSNENPLNAENLTLVCESITGDVLEKNQSEPLVRPKKSARKRTKKSGKKMVLEKSQVINLDDVAIKQELIDNHDPGDSQTELVPGENSKDDNENPKIQTEDFPSPGRNTRSSQRHQSIMHCISAQTSPAVHQNELLAAEASMGKNDDISHDTSNSETNYIQEVSTIDSNENLQDAEDPTLVCESVAEDMLETNQSEPLVQLKKSGRNRSMRRKRQQGKKMTLEKSQVINVDDKAIKQEVIDDHKPGESQTEVVPKENNMEDDHQNQKIHTEDVTSSDRNTRSSQKHHSTMQRISAQTSPVVHQDELTAAEANLETNNDEVSICHGTNNSTIDYIQEDPTLVFNSVPEGTEEKNQYIQKENISSTVLNENLQEVENPILVFDSIPKEAVEKNQSEPSTPPKKSARSRKRKRGKKINVEKSKVINLDDRAIKQELIDGYDTGDLESGLVPGENNSKDDHEMIKKSTDFSETLGEELAEIIAIETSRVTPPLLEQKGNGLHGVIGEHRTKNKTDHGEGILDSSIIPEATVSQGGLVENGETGQDSSEITVFEVEHLQYKGVNDKLDSSSNQNENLPISEEDYQGSPVCECDITVPNPEPHCQTSAESQLIMADSKGENELQVKAEDSPIEIVDTPHNSKITKSKSRRRKGRRKTGKTEISVSVSDVDKQQEFIEMTPESENAHSTPETMSDPHLDDVTFLESNKEMLDKQQVVVGIVPESVPSNPVSTSDPHLDNVTSPESSKVLLDEKQAVVETVPESVPSIPESPSDPHLDDATLLESSNVMLDEKQMVVGLIPETFVLSIPESTSDPHSDDVTSLESSKVMLDEKQAVVGIVPSNPESTSELHLDNVNSLEQTLDKKQVEVGIVPETSVSSIPESTSDPHLEEVTSPESSNVMLDEKQTVVGLIPETFVLSIPESTSDPHLDDVTSLESSKVLLDEKQAVVGIVPSNPESTSELHLDDVNSLEPSNQMLDKKQVEVGKIPETSVPSNPESTSDPDDMNSLKPSNQILDKQQVEVGIVPESVPSIPESTSELHLENVNSQEQTVDKKQVVVGIIPESVPSTPESDLHLGGVTSLESSNQTSGEVKTTNTLLVEDTLFPLTNNTAEKSVDHSLDPDDVFTSESESAHSTAESSSNPHLDVTSPESSEQNLGKIMLVEDTLTNEVDTADKSTSNLQLDVISLESSKQNFRKITLAEDPLTNEVDNAEKSVDQSINSADVSISEPESAHSITVASLESSKQILGKIIVVQDPPTNKVDAAENSVNHNRYPADADPTVGTEKLDYLPEGSGESVPKQSAMQNVEPRQLRRQKTSENDRQKLSGNMSCQLGESPQIVNSSSSVTSGSNEQPPNDLSSPVKNEPVDSSWVEFDGESGISAGVADRKEVSNPNAKPRKKRKSVFGPPRKSKVRKSMPRKISDSVTWESLDLYPVVKLEPIDYSTNLSSGKSQPNDSEAEKLIQTEPVKKRQPTKRKIPSNSEDAVKNCDSFQTAQNQTANTKVAKKNPKSVLQKKPNRTCEISELCEPTLGNCPNVKTEPSECDSMEASVTPEPRYGLQRMRKSPRITPMVNYDERNHDQKISDMSIKIESDTLLSFSQESVCSSTDSNRCGLQKTRKSPRMRPMVNYDERNDDQMETNTPIKIESNTLLSSYQESDLLSTDSDQYCLWQTRKSPRLTPMVNYDERSPRKKSTSLPTSPAYKSTELRPNSADIKSSPAHATSSVPSSPSNNDTKPRPDTADDNSPPPPRKRRKTSLSLPSSPGDNDTKPGPAEISSSPAAPGRLRKTSVSLPPSPAAPRRLRKTSVSLPPSPAAPRRLRKTSVSLPSSPADRDTKPGPYSSPSAASREPRRKSVSLPTSPVYEGTKIRSGPAETNSSPASPGRPRKTSLSLPSSPADKIAKPRPGLAETNSSPAAPRRLRKTSSSVSSSPADGIADIKSSPAASRKPRRKSVSLPASPAYKDTKPRRCTVDTISPPATPGKLGKTSLSLPASAADKIAKPRPGPAETNSSPAASRRLRKTSLSLQSTPADGIAHIDSSPAPSRKPRRKSLSLPASPADKDTKPRPGPAETNSSPCPPKRPRKRSLSVPSSPGDKGTKIRPVPADINSSPCSPKRPRKTSLSIPSSPADNDTKTGPADANSSPASPGRPRKTSLSIPSSPADKIAKPRPGPLDTTCPPVIPRRLRKTSPSVPSSPADGIADIKSSPASSRKPSRRKSVSLPTSPTYKDTKPRQGTADDDSSPVTPRNCRKNLISVLPSPGDGIADINSSSAPSRKPRRKSVSLQTSPVYKGTKAGPNKLLKADTSSPPVTPTRSRKIPLNSPALPAYIDTKPRPDPADTDSPPVIPRRLRKASLTTLSVPPSPVDDIAHINSSPASRKLWGKSVSLPASPVCQDTKLRPGPADTNSPPVTPRRSSRKRSLSIPSSPADKNTKPRRDPADTSSLLASP